METIDEILFKYDTDKNKGVKDGVQLGHCYGNAYNVLFEQFDRNSELNILEIGVQKGGSLLAWKEYFKNANVTGIDILDVRLPEYINENVTFIHSDIRKVNLDTQFDIIIDDGSHFLEDVKFVTSIYIHKLKKNGILIIEDAQSPEVWMSELKSLINQNFTMSSIDLRSINGFYDDFLIIIKKIF